MGGPKGAKTPKGGGKREKFWQKNLENFFPFRPNKGVFFNPNKASPGRVLGDLGPFFSEIIKGEKGFFKNLKGPKTPVFKRGLGGAKRLRGDSKGSGPPPFKKGGPPECMENSKKTLISLPAWKAVFFYSKSGPPPRETDLEIWDPSFLEITTMGHGKVFFKRNIRGPNPF